MSTPTEVANMLTKRVMDRSEGNDTQADPASDPSPNEGTVSKSRNPQTQRSHRTDGRRVLNDLMDDAGEADDDPLKSLADDDEGQAEPPATDDTEGDDTLAGADEGEEGEGEEEGTTTEEDGADDSHVELDEGYTLSVRVDGEDREVTLRELIDNFSHSGAADKRLQEATETLKEAKASRDKALNDAEKVQNSVYSVLEQIDKSLHTPMVSKPDEAMKQRDPNRYLRHLEAYQQDQERIRQSQEALKTAFAEQGKTLNETMETNKKEQFQLVRQNLPALRNPETQKQAMDDIVEAGRHFGFSDEEIASGVDHRMYLMAYYANQYLKSTKGKVRMDKAKPSDDAGNANRSPNRVMRSGGTKPSGKRTQQQKKTVALRKAAQTTGKPEDVAAYLAQRRKGG